jgi:hypothetical protein
MNLPDPSINLVPVIVAAVINMIIGAFWYSPALFGKLWMKAMGKSPEEIQKQSMPLVYVVNTIASLVFAYILAHIMKFGSVNEFSGGVIVGFWVWLGFVITTVLPGYMFESRPKLLYFIFIIYQLFSISIMGGILAIWK